VNWPKVERTPKLTMATQQPQIKTVIARKYQGFGFEIVFMAAT
jgi:hypothetical protein